jgi:hypothetical protein
MITLASECLLFELANGESVPFSAEMISVELTGDQTEMFDPEFVKHATNAVFHYFKYEVGRETITVGEFAGALEKVLRGFEFQSADKTEDKPGVRESDLARILHETGTGCELFFFRRLRDELRQQLQQDAKLVRFRGLRGCVKQLAGAQRWCARCRTLHDQIVEFLRHCLSAESDSKDCSLMVD